MALLTQTIEWKNLIEHSEEIPLANRKIEDPLFSLSTEALSIDNFYQKATKQTVKYLIDLAINAQLSQRINELFEGKSVNITENKPAWHTALRDTDNLQSEIERCLEKMRNISNKIRQKQWLGYTGKPITSILHIGIGGSDLSQRLTVHALEKYADSSIDIHFIANIDPEEINTALDRLNPETTLIIVASKSFSTKETQMNLDKAIQWLGNKEAELSQVIAITNHPERILAKHTILRENIFPIWDWVGGRYSIWSAMGLILMIAIGYENFIQFLKGANNMDKHFRATPFEKNIPVMSALMGIWSINFFDCQTHAIIPYAHRLTYLLPHLQQLDMESNGKSTNIDGEKVDYATGAILWGGVGSNSQHSFHQLLHQGTHQAPIDFITFATKDEDDAHTKCLKINCHAQIQALLKHGQPFIHLITLNELTPYTLGSLMAMYEHKVFVQSQIWRVNPFDQPGVELGKLLAREMT